MKKIPSSEITPEHLYLSRRTFIKGAALTAAAATLAACAPANPTNSAAATQAPSQNMDPTTEPMSNEKDELGNPLTSYNSVTTYNNYYEFGQDKASPAVMARDLVTSPWQVEIGGLVNNPMTIDAADLLKKYDQEERIYRLRCVEAWSMVIPWTGFPIAKLLKDIEPKAEAKYVRFTALMDPSRFPGQRDTYFQWPYVEGLRVDEAMNDLAILATGLYGKPLPNQDGAPLRLVVPWKYGFKSIKAIAKIELVNDMPTSLWMAAAPNEYGFYANVNPDVPHPRWSQSTERRIEGSRIATLKFNGYEKEVAGLYQGMDLSKNF
jgi:sulfoxide reductase catalytic subunit YedY